MKKSHNAEKTSASVALRIHRGLAVYVGLHGIVYCLLSVWGLISFLLPNSPFRVNVVQLLVTLFTGIFMTLTLVQAFRDPENASKTALVLGCVISLFVDGIVLSTLL